MGNICPRRCVTQLGFPSRNVFLTSNAFTSSSSYVAALLLYFKMKPFLWPESQVEASEVSSRLYRATSHRWWGASACEWVRVRALRVCWGEKRARRGRWKAPPSAWEKALRVTRLSRVAITSVAALCYFLKEQSSSVFQLKASRREMRALPSSCYCHVLEQENTTGNKTTDIRHVKNK